MNVLLLHGSSDLYGASKILLYTVAALAKNGHRVTVILTEQGPLGDQLQDAGIEVIFIRLGILRRKYKSIGGITNRLIVLRKAYLAIRQLIKEKNIDTVYTNTTAVLAGAYAARSTGTRHIWHVHEIIERPVWLYRFLGRSLNRYSNTVIVVSESVKKSWLRFVDENKMRRVYNGIDYSAYLEAAGTLRKELSLDDNIVVIGMIARVHPWKGQVYFLEIAAALVRRFSNVRFVMIGDAFPGNEYLYEEIASARKQHNLDAVVYDLGYRTDIPALLQDFDILVLPSVLPDPFPTVILEAMASAKPVVATAHGGATEMIEDGITGVLIPVNDAARAASAMESMIRDKQQRKQMGEAARKKVLAQFSKDAFELNMIKALE